jgi:hypothetical protein
MHRFRSFTQQEKLNENGEEGYKIQLTRCLLFKKTDVKAEKEEKCRLTRSLSRRHTEENPKQGSSGGFFGQKEAGALFPRARSIVALCV